MKIFFRISIFLILISFSSSNAQDNQIWFGSAYIHLGMEASKVVDLLKNEYTFKQFPNEPNAFLVNRKVGSPNVSIGSLYFENKKLVSISKDWGHCSNECLELSNILFNVTSKLNENGKTLAVVKTYNQAKEPDYTLNVIELIFDNRKIAINILESTQFGNSVSVSEMLSE